ncbi:MAG TPA: hypothetical protein VKH42_00870 [Vicinamibacterales bacterium]|nr:hypothetical protein [Vicinamibacterales bacterium]
MNRRAFHALAAVALVAAGAAAAGQTTTQTAKFHFTGLEVLGVKVNDSKKMDIVMVDAVVTGVAHQHFPQLCAKAADIVAGSAPSEGTDTRFGCVYWSLQDYDATVSGASDVGITAGAGAADIPQLSKMAKSGLDTKYLGPEPGPKVAARVHLAGGTLSSEFPSTGAGDLTKAVFKFDPNPDPGSYESRLADSTLTQTLTGNLTITLTALPGKQKPPKTITLKGANPTVPVDVRITNNTATAPCTNDKQVRELDHFKAYYKLLSAPAMREAIPKEKTTELACPGSLNEYIRCPPPEG